MKPNKKSILTGFENFIKNTFEHINIIFKCDLGIDKSMKYEILIIIGEQMAKLMQCIPTLTFCVEIAKKNLNYHNRVENLKTVCW